jgi:hypothetical protein
LTHQAIRTQRLEDIFMPQATMDEAGPHALAETMRHLAAHMAMAMAGLPPSDATVTENLLSADRISRLKPDHIHDAYLVAKKLVIFE